MAGVFGDENVMPSNICDPMAMLMAARKETVAQNDAKVAVKVALEMSEKQKEEEEHLKAVLMMQCEEDAAALEAAAQEEEDMKLAREAQLAEEKAAKEDEERLKSQMSEDEKIALEMQQELAKEFYLAVSKSDNAKVDKMLKQGMDPNAVASNASSRESPLLCAVRIKDMPTIHVLLEAGANPNYQDTAGMSAMHRAAEANRSDIIDVLAKAGAKPDLKTLETKLTPLMLSAKQGHVEPIVTLIKHGADLYAKDKNNKMALNLVPLFSRTLKAKLEAMMGWGLLEACRKGKGDEVMSLIERGASVFLSDDKNMSGLHYAAVGGHNLICEHLLSKKANPNAVDCKGETPLFKAAQAGSGSVWTTLIRHGAKPEVKDSKGTTAAEHCNANASSLAKLIHDSRKRLSPAKASPPKPRLDAAAA